MYNVRITFNIKLEQDSDDPSRDELVLKTKEIYESLRFLSFIVKVKKSLFISECKFTPYDGDNLKLKNKKDEYNKILFSNSLIDQCIKSLEERTSKIEIGLDKM
jgi:hypothetical protein